MSESDYQFFRHPPEPQLPNTVIVNLPSLTPEMLEQIRGVVREELKSLQVKQEESHDEDAFLRNVLRRQLSLGVINLLQYRAEIQRLNKEKKLVDISTLAVSGKLVHASKIELTEEDLAIVGHAPIEAELEHNGKLYKGTLDFVKDVEQ